MPTSFWTAERLTLYPRALLVAFGLAVLIGVLGADGARLPTGGTLGGDYAAFHAAGRIVADGRVEELYDWRAQAQAQADLHPHEPDAFLAFAYPPFVAAAAAPLATLPYATAWCLHTLFQAGCLAGALALLASRWPRWMAWPSAQFALAVSFYPMLRSVLGGQNTALTACCVAFAWRSVALGRPAWAGAAAAALCFKPQFGLPLLALLSLWRPRVWMGAAPVLAGLWAAGAAVAGSDWVVVWWRGIGAFHRMDQDVNAANSVGLLGLCEAVLGAGNAWAVGIGGLATVAVAASTATWWWQGRGSVDRRMALTALTLVLVPPHSMYYDAGLAVLAGLWWWSCGRVGWTLGAWAAGLTSMASGLLGANPLGPLLVAGWLALRADGGHGLEESA